MKIKIIGASVLAASFLVSNVAFAINIPDDIKTKLQDVRLKSCQARESLIKNRSNSLARLVEGMINHFDKIALRVENYYTEKVVPSGKTVANYAELMADIDAKKALVETALQKSKDDFKTFSCTTDDPKGQLALFREDMQAVKKALKDYRASIKNLIVAINSVMGDENSENSNDQQDEANNEQENNQQNNQ